MSDYKPIGNHRFKSAKICEAIAADLEKAVQAFKCAAAAYRDNDKHQGPIYVKAGLHYIRVVLTLRIMAQARREE